MTQTYERFLAEKRAPRAGERVEIVTMPELLFPFQRELVETSLAWGRGAVFADCGLGKTLIQLAWAENVWRNKGGKVLILAPLAVAEQTRREGEKCGVHVTVCREAEDVDLGINVTNYERLERFKILPWTGLVLDESSILKAFDGKTREALTAFGSTVRYRLCCTATPSPNDHEELGGHAEFLGILSRKQMLAQFFVNDGLSAAHWRLKGHGRRPFWTWVNSWARALRSPADLGYPEDGFRLPPITYEVEHVDADSVSDERLFSVAVSTLSERREARRESLAERVSLAAQYVNCSSEPWVVWCDLNAESEALARAIPDALEVKGADDPDVKAKRLSAFTNGQARVIVSKPTIAGWGLNWQHCPNVLFVGLSDSFEQFYQAVRRCWRFGQTRPVRVLIIASRREETVLQNIQRKQTQAEEMFAEMVAAT